MQAYLEVAPYALFIGSYVSEGRGVTDQEFLLNDMQKEAMLSYLENNALMENRYYNYDLIYDNCTTRLRDLLTKTLGNGFTFGQAIPINSRLTFRNECEEYCKNKRWLRLGLELFFSNTDKTMNNSEAMFTPLYLDRGLNDATVSGHKLCGNKITLFDDKLQRPSGVNYAFVFILVISMLTIVGLSVKRISVLGTVMSTILLFTSGLLGICMLYAWFGSAHPEAANNFNILWALPTNIFLPFLPARFKAKYAIAAIVFLGIALIVDLLKIQVMPLFEIWPWLLALFYIYYVMYKNSKTKLPLSSVAGS